MKRFIEFLLVVSIVSVFASIFFFTVGAMLISLGLGVVFGIALLIMAQQEKKVTITNQSPIMEAHDKARDEYAKRVLEGKTPAQRM